MFCKRILYSFQYFHMYKEFTDLELWEKVRKELEFKRADPPFATHKPILTEYNLFES